VSPTRTSLGGRIRERRVELEIGLRELARRLDITPSYLSDIENDRRVPAEDVLRNLAREIDLSFDELTGLAGRLDQQTEKYLRRQPTAAVLFRRLRERGFGEADIGKLIQNVERQGRARKP
jgi:transcriptional regulator with XRE-family HTH domain